MEPCARCVLLTPCDARWPPKFQRFMGPWKPLPLVTPWTSTFCPSTKWSAPIAKPRSSTASGETRNSARRRGTAPSSQKWPRAAAVARTARFRPAPSCSAVYRSLASVLTWTTRQLSTCSAVSAWRRPESSQAPTMPTLTASAPVRRVTSARRADGRPWLWVWRTKRRAK